MNAGRRRGAAGAAQAEQLRSEGHHALQSGDPEAAADHLAAALALEEHGGARLNLAVALNRLGRHDEAEACCRRVLERAPREPMAWINQGMALRALARYDEAERAFRRAGDHPMARYNLGMLQLRRGEWAEGFAALEARKTLTGLGRGLDAPEWDGCAMGEGRLLILAEQGLGDTLMLSRCLPLVSERVPDVAMLVAAPLERLLARSFPSVRFVTLADRHSMDAWIGALSLPHVLRVEGPGDLPAGPWLRADATPTPPHAGLRAGLNWAGNPRFPYDRTRSTALETLSPLLREDSFEWCSLHRGAREHEAAALGLPQPLATAMDFADTADVVGGLDLVVSTETAVPNLAAALGKRTIVLTAPDVDWRWQGWYDTVEVIARSEHGGWPGVVERATAAIRAPIPRAA